MYHGPQIFIICIKWLQAENYTSIVFNKTKVSPTFLSLSVWQEMSQENPNMCFLYILYVLRAASSRI
jgi:hypothetical protein